jgi:hypothetical protein
MVPLIEENVKIGLSVEAALRSANDIVIRELREKQYYGADCYNTVRQCMSLELTLTVARLFDFGSKGRHPNDRDVASIPLLIRLLDQRRCRSFFCRKAREWTPQMPSMADMHADSCTRAIDNAVTAFSSLQQAREGRAAIKTLKIFRDKKLAHSLLESVLKKLPRYEQLFMLMSVARNVTHHTKLAVQGSDYDFDELASGLYDASKAFWEPALIAASRSTH